jgi:hypothetical protein
MNTLTPYENDDGFGYSLQFSDRLIKGLHARWTDSKAWHDRDGLSVPSPLLVVGVTTALQRWENKVPEVIVEKPLPDLDALNTSIPMSKWETGLDGKPRPPWALVFVVYMVDIQSGQTYTALNSTTGWRMAYEALCEAVTVKRMLHGGVRMLPIVDLQSRPFKTSFGMRSRPHLHIVDWRSADVKAPLPAAKTTPQLNAPAPAPVSAPAPAPKTVKQTLDAFAAQAPESHPAAAAANLTDPPKAVSTEEFFDDSIPWK